MYVCSVQIGTYLYEYVYQVQGCRVLRVDFDWEPQINWGMTTTSVACTFRFLSTGSRYRQCLHTHTGQCPNLEAPELSRHEISYGPNSSQYKKNQNKSFKYLLYSQATWEHSKFFEFNSSSFSFWLLALVHTVDSRISRMLWRRGCHPFKSFYQISDQRSPAVP